MNSVSNTPVNHTPADYETQATHGTNSINVPPPPKNGVEEHQTNMPPPPPQGPASYGRDATQPSQNGYAAPPPNVNGPGETHGSKPVESQESKDAAQLAKDLQYILSIPTQEVGGRPGVVSLTWLQAVVNDPFRSSASKAAAQRLLDNPAWSRADADHSGKLTLGEAGAYADKMKANDAASSSSGGSTTSTTDSGKPPSDADVGGTSPGGATTSTSNSASADAPKKSVQDILDSVPKPPPSSRPGMEGALENLGNSADYLQKQMEAIANDPNLDAGMKSAKMANLQSQQQLAMNMLNQLSQMMQNTMKLWSDIAMNSVRNIK